MASDTLKKLGTFRRFINISRAKGKADTVLHGGRIVNVFTGEIMDGDIAIFKDRIAGIGSYTGRRRIDCSGLYILPGLIDGHIHLESTLLSPLQFSNTLIGRGTTTVVIDPHEIANITGVRGIKWLLRATRDLPIDFFFMIPSCIPASGLEKTGVEITHQDIENLLKEPRVLGLAEVMDVTGVLEGKAGTIKKLIAAGAHLTDGHAPLLRGPDLNAYIAAGIGSDHETTNRDEALEKLRLGMRLMIREGSLAKDIAEILKLRGLITSSNRSFFVSDDILPQDLLEEGHIDRILRRGVSLGLDPVEAVRMATLYTAEYFGLRDRGGIAPGRLADLVAVKDLKDFSVHWVMKRGKPAIWGRRVRPGRGTPPPPSYLSNSVKAVEVKAEDLRITEDKGPARIIGLVPGSLLTRSLRLEPRIENGLVIGDTVRDIIKIAVRDRHRRRKETGIGLVHGFGIKSGALASTFAHDSHNIIAVGVNDEDITMAMNHLIGTGGGMVVVDRGRIVKDLPLPVGGLLSDRPAKWVVNRLCRLERAAKGLGTKPAHPFTTLSFMALPVIPDLKITEAGLVDVRMGKIVRLFGR